jgi:hypothetical protein
VYAFPEVGLTSVVVPAYIEPGHVSTGLRENMSGAAYLIWGFVEDILLKLDPYLGHSLKCRRSGLVVARES